MERRALVEGISSALDDLRVEFERRLEATLRTEVGAIKTRLSETSLEGSADGGRGPA